MTTEEKRSRLKTFCKVYNPPPHNSCDRCKIRESCRKTGHPPEYMKDEAVELVFNDAVQCGIFRDELTVDEMREKLVRICDTVEDCFDGACPIGESCDACSTHSPMKASDDEIKAIFADLIRRGSFSEYTREPPDIA